MFYYVYIYLNPQVDGFWSYKNNTFKHQPIYVGIGVGRRYTEHLNVTIKARKKESNFTKFNLIKKLIDDSTPPIILKLYENITKNDAKIIEIDIINHFGKLINKTGILTNITDGGDQTKCNQLGKENPHSKKVFQYDLNGHFIKEWDCLREIGRILNVSYNSIGDCCRNDTKTSYGFQWFYQYKGEMITSIKSKEQPLRRKKVYKFDLNGKLIKIYESLESASDNNSIKKTNLGKIITNKKYYKKFFFSYENKFDPNKLYGVYKILYNGEIMFLTIPEIMIKFNVAHYYVYSVKKNKIKNPKFELGNY